MTCKVQKSNIGTVFQLTIQDCSEIAIDVSTATTMEIVFESPAGTRTAKTATHTTDGTNGQIEYASESGLLDEAGYWNIQGHVVIGAQDLYTTISTFEVENNL
jgi:hypothetical protein